MLIDFVRDDIKKSKKDKKLYLISLGWGQNYCNLCLIDIDFIYIRIGQ